MNHHMVEQQRRRQQAMLTQQQYHALMTPLGELNNRQTVYPPQMSFPSELQTFEQTPPFYQDASIDPLWSLSAPTNDFGGDDWGASVDWTQLPNLHAMPSLDSAEAKFLPTEAASPNTDTSEELFGSVSQTSSSASTTSSSLQRTDSGDIRCWEHGCNGRTFSSLSNYRRHCKEKSKLHPRAVCPRCGRQFSRAAARDVHYNQRRCKLTCLDHNRMPFQISMN